MEGVLAIVSHENTYLSRHSTENGISSRPSYCKRRKDEGSFIREQMEIMSMEQCVLSTSNCTQNHLIWNEICTRGGTVTLIDWLTAMQYHHNHVPPIIRQLPYSRVLLIHISRA